MEKKLTEQINESNQVDFSRKNLLIWIGSMNEKPTAWIGTANDNMPIVDYKMDFESKDEAIKYITETLRKLSSENSNKNNLDENDILTIQNILEGKENKLKTSNCLI